MWCVNTIATSGGGRGWWNPQTVDHMPCTTEVRKGGCKIGREGLREGGREGGRD